MNDFSAVQPGCLKVGTLTPFGEIEAVSLTAYNCEGTWVPFFKVHGKPVPVLPLVVFG